MAKRTRDVKMPADVGAPTKLEEWMLKRVKALAMTGYSNERIAGIFGVNFTTFQRWIGENEIFRNELRAGREFASADAVVGLQERAQGIKKTVEKRVYDDAGTLVRREEQEVYFPPDPGAGKFLIQVRERSIWHLNPEPDEEGFEIVGGPAKKED